MPIQIGEYEKFVKFALIRRLKIKTICKLN